MTGLLGLLARVDDQPVSFDNCSSTSILARVHQQQVSLKIVYCPNGQRYLKASLTLCVSLTLNSTDFRDFEELLKVLM